MSIRFACPDCLTSYTVNDRDAGKKADCKKCGQRLQVPVPPTVPQRTKLGELLPPTPKVSSQPSVPSNPAADKRPRRALTVNDTPGDWWLYTAKDDRKTALTLDQLRLMASDGRLRRRDFVKRKGRSQWKLAGTITNLWPASSPQVQDSSLLTTCGACVGQIAKEAPTCPKCGAPNRWLHSEIVRFQRRLQTFQRRYNGFEIEAKGYQIVGRSVRPKQFLDYAANAVGSMGFVGPLSLSGLAVILGASIGSQYAEKALRDAAGPNAHAFIIDFRQNPPTWSTTDDEFWEDILDFFDLS